MKTGSGDRRVYTTFAVELKVFWKADAELMKACLLFCRWLGDAPQADLATVDFKRDSGAAPARNPRPWKRATATAVSFADLGQEVEITVTLG